MASNESFPDCLIVNFPKASQVFLLCLCSVCCISAVGGNILVLLAVYKTRSLQNLSMYFLASLSFADLMVGFLMTTFYIVILALYNVEDKDLPRNFFDLLSRVENFFWVSTLVATTLSLCGVSIDRYIAVMYSLRYRQLVTTRRCIVSIASIWLFSFGFAASLFICGNDYDAREVFWVVCFALAVGVPFVVIVFCNIKLAIAARRQIRLIQGTSVHSEIDTTITNRAKNAAKNRKATITAIIVSMVFFALFYPQLVVFILLLETDDECYIMELQIVWIWVAIVSFFHSAVNPWIYCIRSREFRKAIRKQLL